MATSGILDVDSGRCDYSFLLPHYEKAMLSTCKIYEAWEGGPLFDFDGNFVGMNLFSLTERTLFLPAVIILVRLAHFTSLRSVKFPADRVGERLTDERPNSNQEVHRDVLNVDQFWDLDSDFPTPSVSMLNDGMILFDTFEDPFGDVCGKGVWSELSEAASSKILGNTVALASFNGEKRVFACTGFFIAWNGCTTILTSASLVRNSGYENKIVENLRIEVLLPDKRREQGTLQHYNLHYNVALVSVKDYCARDPAVIQRLQGDHSCEVLAVGRVFKSGKLMAARGRQFASVVTLDCKYLGYSTCKITKAGIGGPLVDFDGRFIGMNFYDKKIGTPFLLWSEILSVLEHFKTKGTVAAVGNGGNPSRLLDWRMAGDHSTRPNRWPVPKPYWCHPDDLHKHE